MVKKNKKLNSKCEEIPIQERTFENYNSIHSIIFGLLSFLILLVSILLMFFFNNNPVLIGILSGLVVALFIKIFDWLESEFQEDNILSKKSNSRIIKEIDWEMLQTIASYILIIFEIFLIYLTYSALINSINASNLSLELTEKLTPSKYAYITAGLIDYTTSVQPMETENINNGTLPPIKLNVINSGQMNTGFFQIDKRDDVYNSDNTFAMSSIGLEYQVNNSIIRYSMNSSANQVFTLNFTWYNRTNNLIGLHQINISIFCANCIDQNRIIINPIYLCVYNWTDFDRVNNLTGLKYWNYLDNECNLTKNVYSKK